MAESNFVAYVKPDLLDSLVDRAPNVEAKTAFRLSFHSGLRRFEVLGLEWRDIDFTSRLIQVRNGKGGKARQVPMATSLLYHLQARRESMDPKRLKVVLSANRWNLSRWFKEAVRKCAEDGLLTEVEAEELHFHSLRHGFARYHINDRGVSLPVVSSWLGHAKVSTTLNIYAPVIGSQYSHMME